MGDRQISSYFVYKEKGGVVDDGLRNINSYGELFLASSFNYFVVIYFYTKKVNHPSTLAG